MREMCEAAVLDHEARPLNGRRLEQCFDRMMRRIPGESTDAESWHCTRRGAQRRSRATTSLAGGSTLTLSKQYAELRLGTHNEEGARDRNAGFAKITSPEEHAHYQAIADAHGPVEIPPGHILIFYERLVHEVLKVTATRIMRRPLFGQVASNGLRREPLFGQQQTNAWIDGRRVPKIKSGQKPAIYPSAYYNFPRSSDADRLLRVGLRAGQCSTSTSWWSGAQAGTAWTRVERYMKGLADYGAGDAPGVRAAEASQDPVPESACSCTPLTTRGGPRVGRRCVASVAEWEEYEGPRVFTIDEYGNLGRRCRAAGPSVCEWFGQGRAE